MTATSEGSSTITYAYDGDGTRLQASTGPNPADTTEYVWDVNAGLPQLALERDGSGFALRSYLLGNDTVAMAAGGETSYFHYDGLGSVVNVTSAAGESAVRARPAISPIPPSGARRPARPMRGR